jgi:sec-independent protein translocase protein TatC
MDEVVGFMLAMLLGTGVAFELPVVLAVMGWLGLIKAKGLWRFNKYALVLSAVVGGVLTPGPDVLSQVLMAGPLFGLYNVSILIVWIIERARRKKLEEMAKATGADLVPME